MGSVSRGSITQQTNEKGHFVRYMEEMGGACGVYGGGERCAQGFGGEA